MLPGPRGARWFTTARVEEAYATFRHPAVVLVTLAGGKRVRSSRGSVMPAGLDQQLTPGELADLVAFLKACQ